MTMLWGILEFKLQLEEGEGEDHEEAEEEEEEPEGAEPEEDLCELKWDGSSNDRVLFCITVLQFLISFSHILTFMCWHYVFGIHFWNIEILDY